MSVIYAHSYLKGATKRGIVQWSIQQHLSYRPFAAADPDMPWEQPLLHLLQDQSTQGQLQQNMRRKALG